MSASTKVDARPGEMSHRQILEALSGLLLVLFVAMASSTIVSTALPKIIGALNGSQTQYTWVVTASLLTATASTPIWGKLADLYSKKLLVQISIVVFVLGSIVAGFSQTASELIAARAFQGLGLGGVQALVQVAIAAMIPPRERGRYNGYLGGVMGLATVGAPLLGGLIVDTDWLGWRWCFFIGAPIAVISRPETIDDSRTPAIIGMVSRPASVGLYPRPIWKYWPRKTAPPNIAMPTARLPRMASAVVRSRMIPSGTTGSAARDSTRTASASSTTETPTRTKVCQESQAKELSTKEIQISRTLTPAAISVAPA